MRASLSVISAPFPLKFAICALAVLTPACLAQTTKPAKPAPPPRILQRQRQPPPQQRQVPPQQQRPPQQQQILRQQPGQRGGVSQQGQGPRPPAQPPKPSIAARAPAIPANARPMPKVGGGSTYTTAAGQKYTTNSQGRVTEYSDKTHVARYDSQGQARFIQTTHNGMTTSVSRGVGGTRMVQTQYPNGTRVVSYGPHNGYAEQPIPGRTGFVSRTYTVNSVTTVSVYRSYSYRGYAYYGYVPAYYYAPGYYNWVLSPWGPPIAYGWGAYPWGGYYGAYFTPYPMYPSADLWLTDYLFYSSLQMAYAARQASPEYQADPNASYVAGDQTAGAAPPPPLDPSVKMLMDKQVKTDVADMQAQGGSVPAPSPSALPVVLQPDHTTFQVSTDTELSYGQDQSCMVGPGDVLFRNPQSTTDASGYVEVMVLGSKPGGCPMSTQAKISLATLGNMNNQFEQQLQSGMQLLAAKAGSGSIPPSPAMGATQIAAGQAPPQPNVDNLLAQNQASASQAETEIQGITSTQANPTT